MKIEPQKIKKTLKYAAVGACVATSLISTGCENVMEDVIELLPIDLPWKTEKSMIQGVMPADVPDFTLPPKSTSNPIVTEEPDIAGGIPAPTPPNEELELAGDIAFYDELDPSGVPPQ